ncbi:MAG: gamma-glutamyltransferase family protein [Provencibacterium sp.]|jgi:gamma-glutamyltranspeptidase/glutathione hydrolase|nr:gamma-glutamyltransferase family protein [Provencibacterium sp.]
MPLSYDPCQRTFPCSRSVQFARRGMVCTSQPLAAQAGLDVLRQGGNAIDAAVAAAACMTVLEPVSNSLGSDCFAIVFSGGQLYGLNGSGPSPAALSLCSLLQAGYRKMPQKGWLPVMVPGAPQAWAQLQQRFGCLPLSRLLEPAAAYAEEGFPVSPVISRLWERAVQSALKSPPENSPGFQEWLRVFAPQGRAPRAGEIWSSPAHAATLRELGETGCESLYRGRLAEEIDRFSRRTGGTLRADDLKDFSAEWVSPIHADYRGYTVWELPPNGHGLTALMALQILEGFSLSEREDVETVHRQIEAMKLALTDGMRYIADPRFMKARVEELLSPAYIARRRALIGSRALLPQAGDPFCGGTIYLCTADREGNMVSLIQSSYLDFGAHLVVPGTGIALNNRGCNFSLNPQMENCAGPGKRSYHTIIPGFLTKDGQPLGPFGVMGAFMQPQGHLQLISNLIDFQMNPQEALDAPRWQWTQGREIMLEPGFPQAVARQLSERGHLITTAADSLSFGRGQLIVRGENGVLAGATEPRTDGTVACW